MREAIARPRVLCALACSVAVVGLMTLGVMNAIGPQDAHARTVDESSAPELESILLRSGLDAESLAAVGLTSGSAGTVVATAAEYALDHLVDIRSADETFATADSAYGSALRAYHRDPSTAEALSAAANSLAVAASARNDALSAVLAAGTSGLTNEQSQDLTRIYVNRVHCTSAALAIVDRTQPQWKALQDALTNERIQTARGQAVDEDAADLLTAARGASAVSTAQAAITTNLASVSVAWNAAIADALGE